ncbi:MAG: hypothetical protein KAR30_08155 [Gammaproteobacteria bacterium]|nr:hypothetical protein [Gammaproteobacteria bacterium]
MKSIEQMSLESAKPGSILAYDVLDSREKLLLKAGIKLTEQALVLLERKNISHVHIIDDVMKSAGQLEVMRKKIDESLAMRFRNTNASPDMCKLKSILLDYQLEK